MAENAIDKLRKYFGKVADVMRGNLDAADVFPNNPDKGSSRENAYIEMLRHHLPISCDVFAGGFLFGSDGSTSKQIDAIVSNDLNLQFKFQGKNSKSFASVDGAIGAISIKSNLYTRDLRNALENLDSIPRKKVLLPLRRPFSLQDYDQWPYKIIFARRGMSAKRTIDEIGRFYEGRKRGYGGVGQVDMVHVLDKFIILRHLNYYKSYQQTDGALGLLNAIVRLQKIAQQSRLVAYHYDELLGMLQLDRPPM